MGPGGGRAGGRGDPAHEHGPRRHRGWLRARADTPGGRRRGRAGDRLGRSRHARPPRRGGRSRRSRRGAVRLDLPLPPPQRGGGEGAYASGRHTGARVTATTHDLRERIRRLAGMDRLLPALEGLPPAYLVGGAVRDLLRGAGGIDLDLAVEGDAGHLARRLAERLDGRTREHERFGTVAVRAEGLSFDVAQTRRERYARPGALPEVEPASLREDLARRDFTVNAMAVGLTGENLGH